MTVRKKNADWLALTIEEPIEPDLPICDPHHHLWDGETARVVPRYLLDEILEDTRAGHNIVSTVFIECGAMFKPDGPEALRPVGETEFVNGIAAMSASGLYGATRIAAGIVGTAQLRLGEAAAPVLDAQIAAGGGRFRGIRLGAAWDADPAVPNHRTRPPQGMLGQDDFGHFDVPGCRPLLGDEVRMSLARRCGLIWLVWLHLDECPPVLAVQGSEKLPEDG
jgi:hypothetical protein